MLSAKTREKPRSLPPLSLVEVEGDGALCDRLGGALRRKGRLPLMFDRSELEPAFVHHVVRSAVEQYEL
jgi:hypothetical protein